MLAGLAALLTQQILMVLVWNKPIALFAMCIGSIGNLTFPAISSIMSLNVPQSEQVSATQPRLHRTCQATCKL